MEKERLVKIAAGIFAISIILIMNPEITWITYINFPFCQERITQLAEDITKESADENESVYDVAQWVAQEVIYGTGYCKKSWTDCETLYKRCGACGEKADLIRSLLGSIGIVVTSVGTRGEDHTWNDVLINGGWVAFDASVSQVDWNFSKRDFEEKKNRTYSVIRKHYPNGTEVDVTSEYTDTGHVMISVIEENGKPISEAKVIAKSHCLMEKVPQYYFEPKETAVCYTNSDGFCELEMGGNNYTFAVYKYHFRLELSKHYFIEYGYLTQTEPYLLMENSDLEITIVSKIDPEKALVLFIIIIAVVVIIVYIFIKLFYPIVNMKKKFEQTLDETEKRFGKDICKFFSNYAIFWENFIGYRDDIFKKNKTLVPYGLIFKKKISKEKIEKIIGLYLRINQYHHSLFFNLSIALNQLEKLEHSIFWNKPDTAKYPPFVDSFYMIECLQCYYLSLGTSRDMFSKMIHTIFKKLNKNEKFDFDDKFTLNCFQKYLEERKVNFLSEYVKWKKELGNLRTRIMHFGTIGRVTNTERGWGPIIPEIILRDSNWFDDIQKIIKEGGINEKDFVKKFFERTLKIYNLSYKFLIEEFNNFLKRNEIEIDYDEEFHNY